MRHKMRFIDSKNDVAFRKIFGNENKTKILIAYDNASVAEQDERCRLSLVKKRGAKKELIRLVLKLSESAFAAEKIAEIAEVSVTEVKEIVQRR